MTKPKILFAVMKGYWFDRINSGEKPVEYRELKEYWIVRLCSEFLRHASGAVTKVHFKEYTHIMFQRGYQRGAPRMLFSIKEITVEFPKPEWCEPGADKQRHFAIWLDKRYA